MARRTLMVDDGAVIARMVRAQLETSEYNVLIAKDAQMALQMLHHSAPHRNGLWHRLPSGRGGSSLNRQQAEPTLACDKLVLDFDLRAHSCCTC